MRYGQNPLDVDAAEQAVLNAIEPRRELRWHLWLDSAFDAADETPPAAGYGGVNAWADDEMLTLQHLAPWVLPLYAPGDSRDQVVARLRPWLTHAGARPMLSLWASAHGAQQLAQHMRAWSVARGADGERLLLRLADGRSIALLARLLTPAQWQGLTQPLAAWHIVDREGRWQAMPLASEPAADLPRAPAAQPPIALSEEQLQAMAEAAEADALLHHVITQDGEELPATATPAGVYAYTADVLRMADRHGVDNLDDKLSLLRAVFMTRGKVLEAPELTDLLVLKEYTSGQLARALVGRGLLGD